VKLFLVRHGETEWNKLGRFQGQNDNSLNELGLAQARDTARAAISWKPSALYSSPLCRTMQVAEEISHLVGLLVIPEPRLKELDLGELEGVTGEEMRTGWPRVYKTWRNDPQAVVMPGGESLVQLQERTWQAFQSLENAHNQGDVIVLVSHNFAIRALCGKLLGLPLSHFHRMYLSLGSVSIMERSPLGWRLLTYNSTCHLSPENRTGH
jgi:broad specificity phosphatase PhoE